MSNKFYWLNTNSTCLLNGSVVSNRIWHELIKPQLITWLLCIVLCRIYGSCPILPLLFEPNSYVCVTDSNRFAKFIWCKPKRIEQENLGGSRYILKILYGNPIMFSFLSFFFIFFFFSTTTDLRNDNVTKTIHMRIFVNIFNKGSTT